MRNPSLFPLLGILPFASRSLQQQPANFFIVPPDAGSNNVVITDRVYTLNSVLNISWVTNQTSFGIYLWQQDVAASHANVDSTGVYRQVDGPTGAGSAQWQVSTQSFDLSFSNVFFFNLGPYASLQDTQTTSHLFNITAGAVTGSGSSSSSSGTSTSSISSSTVSSSSSSSATSATLSTPSTSSTAIVQSSSPTASATNTSSSSAGSSSSNGTSIGLGVGLGVGIPIILILAGLLGLQMRKYMQSRGRGGGRSTSSPTTYPEFAGIEHKSQPLENSSSLERYEPRRYELGAPTPRGKYAPAELGAQ